MNSPLFVDRTVLVTGATSGIGYATALRFAREGALVLLHARDSASGEDAVARLVAEGVEPSRLRLFVADFRSLAEVSAMAREISETVPGLDVLVNNAAIAGPEYRRYSADGHEITFAVNYLAPYALTDALSETLTRAHGRVVNVSSSLHRGGSIGWHDLDRARQVSPYSPLGMYAQSKLALTIFTRSLAAVHEGAFTAIAVHPGVVATALQTFYGRADATADEAAAILVEMSAPGHEVSNGGYYDKLDSATPAVLVDNARARARLSKLAATLVSFRAENAA